MSRNCRCFTLLVAATAIVAILSTQASAREAEYGEQVAAAFQAIYGDSQFAVMTLNRGQIAQLSPQPLQRNGPTQGDFNYLSFVGADTPVRHAEYRILTNSGSLQYYNSGIISVVTIYTKYLPCAGCRALLLDWLKKQVPVFTVPCFDWCKPTFPPKIDSVPAKVELWYSTLWEQTSDAEAYQTIQLLIGAGFDLHLRCPLTVDRDACSFQQDFFDCLKTKPVVCDICSPPEQRDAQIKDYINTNMSRGLRSPVNWANLYNGVRKPENQAAFTACATAAQAATIGIPLR